MKCYDEREHLRHVDIRVHYLRELVREGHVKMLKCAGPQNVADALTKSLPRPALAKHRQHMWGTRMQLSAFYLSQDWTVSESVLRHHENMKSHALPEKYFLEGRMRIVCMCVC